MVRTIASAKVVIEPECLLQLPESYGPLNLSQSALKSEARNKVWVIFGATGHAGRSIARCILAHGDAVVAVGWSLQETEDCVRQIISSSDPLANDQDLQAASQLLLPLVCDVREPESVQRVFERTLARWSRYDNIVSCAGHGIIGPCEEQDDSDLRNQFETNFWGTLNIIQASMSYFRSSSSRPLSATGMPDSSSVSDPSDSRGGRYIILSSTSGITGMPGLGPYSATKHANEGLIESMFYESLPFNIYPTMIELGYLSLDATDIYDNGQSRTDKTAASTKAKDEEGESNKFDNIASMSARIPTFRHFSILPVPPTSAYAAADAPAHHTRRTLQWLGNNRYQVTRVTRCAELIWQLGHCARPPLRMALGDYVLESMRDRYRLVADLVEASTAVESPAR